MRSMVEGEDGRAFRRIAALPLRHLRRHLPLAGEDVGYPSARPNSASISRQPRSAASSL
jgi:hypothetical protein